VETLGKRAGPNSVFFYPAGTLHGMRNVGNTPARYVVFEFHARRWRNAARVQNQMRRARRLGSRAGRDI
jgi:mannose-6-phosphate isomerase-like protein (cupin superfamily)